MTVSLPIALAVGDVRGYCVLSNHCHIQILDVSHDLQNGFVSGPPFSSPPPPSPIGRPDTQARNKCFLYRGTHITRYLCFLCRRTCTTRDVCSWAGEHISLGICVSWVRETHFTLDMCSLCFLVGEQISLGICVSCVGEHISLGISVPLPMKHISLGIIMCPR